MSKTNSSELYSFDTKIEYTYNIVYIFSL